MVGLKMEKLVEFQQNLKQMVSRGCLSGVGHPAYVLVVEIWREDEDLPIKLSVAE